MDSAVPPSDTWHLTRERLRSGRHIESMRQEGRGALELRSQAELDASLERVLAARPHGQACHVFAYGSLLWNPALDFSASFPGRVQGWHRSFCIRSIVGRGSPDAPGAMLGLDAGGACSGLVYRVEAPKALDELRLLWRREMLTGVYDARWVRVRTPDERLVEALTFVVDRRHARYLGRLPEADLARLIRTGRGGLGTSIDYFESTRAALSRLGLRDAGLERLARAVGGG